MQVIIHHINFKPSKALDAFIKEKSQALAHIDSSIIGLEYHLKMEKDLFFCNALVDIKGQNIDSKRSADDIHYAILKCIDALKKSLRKKKTIRINSKKKKTNPDFE